MPLWGTSNTISEAKPKYLSGEDKERCFATSQGWIIRTDKGNGRFSDEVLVSVGGLGVALANADITSVFFSNTAASYVQNSANAFVTVVFNEPVTIANGTPTIAVTGSTSGAITATYNAGSGTNQLLFKFTVPAVTQTLSLSGQTITANNATFLDAAATPATVLFANGVVRAVSGKATGTANVAVA